MLADVIDLDAGRDWVQKLTFLSSWRYFKKTATARCQVRAARVTPFGMSADRIILVVEDEPFMRECLVEFLTADGFHTIEAGNVEEALVAFAEHPEIRLLFTDVLMPGKPDGVADVGGALLTLGAFRHRPLALSARLRRIPARFAHRERPIAQAPTKAHGAFQGPPSRLATCRQSQGSALICRQL
jgi:CheY-like chemotaxis protein